MTPPARIEEREIAHVAELSCVMLPGRLQAVLRDDRVRDNRVVRDLQPGEPLLANTLVAALLTPDELRAHLYIVHKASEGKLVTVIGYARAEALRCAAGAELRVPQDGAWLVCPSRGMVFVVASDRPLTRRELSKLLRGQVLGARPLGAATLGAATPGAATPRAVPPPLGSDDDVLVAP